MSSLDVSLHLGAEGSDIEVGNREATRGGQGFREVFFGGLELDNPTARIDLLAIVCSFLSVALITAILGQNRQLVARVSERARLEFIMSSGVSPAAHS